jgi:hypothetical protein
MKMLNKHRIPIHYALLALFFSLLASLANQSWQFNPYGWVDHWGYLGLQNFPLNLREVFPLNPVGDLLPVILPSFLINHILPLEAAQYVRGIIYLAITIWLILMIVSRSYTSKIAISVAALFVGSQYALTTLGATYPSGSVMLYLTLAIYIFQRKTKSNYSKKKFFRVVISGMSIYFLAVYSAVLAIGYLPAITAFVFFQFYQHIDFSLRYAILLFTGALVTAALVVTGTLQTVYSFYGEGFFFSNNISKLFGFTVGNAYRAPAFSTWLPYASWLVIPCATVLASLMLVLFSKIKKDYNLDENDYAFFSLAIVVFMTLVATNLVVHQWSLQFMYFTQTESIFFLSLAPLMKSYEKMYVMKWIPFLPYYLFAFSIFSLNLAETRHYTFQNFSDFFNNLLNINGSHPLRFIVVVTLVLALTVFLGSVIRSLAIVSVIMLMVVNMYSFSPTFGCFACFNSLAKVGTFQGIDSARDNTNQTLKFANLLNEIDPNRVGKIWYNEMDPLGPFFRQVNAVFYLNEGQRRVSKSFPQLTDAYAPIGSGGSTIEKNDNILLLTPNVNDFSVASNSVQSLGMTAILSEVKIFRLSPTTTVYAYSFTVT